MIDTACAWLRGGAARYCRQEAQPMGLREFGLRSNTRATDGQGCLACPGNRDSLETWQRCWDKMQMVNILLSYSFHPKPAIMSPNSLPGLVAKSCLTLETPWTVAGQAPLSMGFPTQEYWSGLSFPSPEDLPNARIEPRSPILQAASLLSEPLSLPTLL